MAYNGSYFIGSHYCAHGSPHNGDPSPNSGPTNGNLHLLLISAGLNSDLIVGAHGYRALGRELE